MRTLHPILRDVSLEGFRQELGADVVALLPTMCLLGFSASLQRWLVSGFLDGGGHGRERLDPLARFLECYVRPHIPARSFWFFFDHWDAWREAVGPEEIPTLSPSRRWVACYGARRSDPTALLVPEAHYLGGRYYRTLLARMTFERVRWGSKRARAIFAGGDHGPSANGPTPRRRLRSAAEAGGLPVDVHLGQAVGRRRQMTYKYLLDVDGWVRTWDAWAWKLASGSVVLSPASDWTTFFTELFEPWEHFVPVAGDFSDLGERLEWCRQHDEECREIVRRARSRVQEVYRPAWAGKLLAQSLHHRLPGAEPVDVCAPYGDGLKFE